jgi:hypothetical protein
VISCRPNSRLKAVPTAGLSSITRIVRMSDMLVA